MPRTGRQADASALLERALAVALEAADPRRAVRRALTSLAIEGDVALLSLGKAAGPMADTAVEVLGGQLVAALAVMPDGCPTPTAPMEVLMGAHPLPDARSIAAGRTALGWVSRLPASATLVALISGGGSSALELPRPGVTLEDLRRVTGALLRTGASIAQLNAVRGRLSQIKRGGLLAACTAHRVVNVVLSDVPGLDPAWVASGPTSPAPTVAPSRAELERLLGRVVAGLDQDPRVDPRRVTTRLAASAETVRDAVGAALASEHVVVHPHIVEGEARVAGPALLAALDGLPAEVRGLVACGEVTVTVRGHGVGGPASELALACLLASPSASILALGTDGIDGNGSAAGARVTTEVRCAARDRGLHSEAALASNDAETFFRAAGGAIVTGPTGSNLAELYLLVR